MWLKPARRLILDLLGHKVREEVVEENEERA